MGKKVIKMTPNQLLNLLRNASWDRPSAYYELCARAKIRGTIPELAMHARSKVLGWEGDEPEALAHIEKHFGKRAVSAIFTGEWDT